MSDFYQPRNASREEKKELQLAFCILIAIPDELFKLRVYKFCEYRYYVGVSKKDTYRKFEIVNGKLRRNEWRAYAT